MKFFSSIFLILVISFIMSISLNAQEISQLEQSLFSEGFVDVRSCDTTYVIDMKYATTDNFTKQILYDSLHIPFLHPAASKKLCIAHQYLKQKNPNYRFIIFDVARPLQIQKKMYDVVKNTPYHAYVANPVNTGLHNYGMAVDLSIIDITTNEQLDMGTAFDFFGSKAGIRDEEERVENGTLTQQQYINRHLLRDVMKQAGFSPILGEWWHFNAVSRDTARKNYQVIE